MILMKAKEFDRKMFSNVGGSYTTQVEQVAKMHGERLFVIQPTDMSHDDFLRVCRAERYFGHEVSLVHQNNMDTEVHKTSRQEEWLQ